MFERQNKNSLERSGTFTVKNPNYCIKNTFKKVL